MEVGSGAACADFTESRFLAAEAGAKTSILHGFREWSVALLPSHSAMWHPTR